MTWLLNPYRLAAPAGAGPTHVSTTQVSWAGGTNTLTTASISVQSGDLIVVMAASEGHQDTLGTPDGGSLTYTPQQSNVITDNCNTYCWTATASSTTSFTVAITKSAGIGGHHWGFAVFVFRGAALGNTAKNNGTGGPTLNITTTAASSQIVVIAADYEAIDGASRTWRTAGDTPTPSGSGEHNYYRSSANYTTYLGRHLNAGAAGAKTVGLSAPTGQKFTIIAAEITGA